MSDLESNTRYVPAEVEPRISERWLKSGLWHPDPDGTPEQNYSIAIPPPNVTGVLHMGHALNSSVQDCLVRHARMSGPPGRRTKWIIGTDHAGIATQTQVERTLGEQGTSREQLGRERFVERVWEWRSEYGGQIVEQLKRLGASCDYEEERFTLDGSYVQAVLKVFVALYGKGWIYRDRYLVNWDPGSRSAISDLEVEEREVTDTLYYIDYPLASGSGAITVATVRPETVLADVAIAVNPGDDRYRRLIGETAILPLVGRRLRIIADDYVKPEFGTGALKITPGHDPNDFEIGARHGLPHPSVIGEDGRITAEAPERFAGLTVAEARRAVVAELRDQGLIARAEDYTHEVPFSHRSGERIEPLISLQWFMRMDELAKPAIQAVRQGRVRIRPESQRRRYLDWLENIRPWCISRQLWWGHQIPVWYRGDQTHVGETAPAGDGWVRDPDVLDTWFSSAMWPFATLGWPEQTRQLAAFYPTDALVTSRDIIFLWVARMVMMGLEFTGDVPFADVYVHSIIQAPDGRRMSKSLGTGIDPLDLIDGGPRPSVFALDGGDPGEFPAYGADAVRWGLLAMSSGQDVKFSEERVAQGQQLTNKLWNASRLILMRVEPAARAAARPTTVEDRWILSRLGRARREVSNRIEDFDFSRAAIELYEFVYSELCDWYLELVKPRLYGGDFETATTLLHVLTETVTLAHPLIPFVTEEIYSHIPGAEGLLAGRVAPADAQDGSDASAEAALRRLIDAVQAVRNWRDSADVRASAVLPARLQAEGYADTDLHLGRITRLALNGTNGADPADAAVAVIPVPGGTVEILQTVEVDVSAADRRREAKRAELESDIRRAEGKLANEGFVAKAPPAVVQAERDKLAAFRAELEALSTDSLTPVQAERRLLSLELFGMRFGLDRMLRLMTALDHPEREFRSVHVVGTNGKSSTVRMLAAIIARHGHRTGAYLSPHLTSFWERIRVDDADIAPHRFALAIERALRAAERVNRAGEEGDIVTQFELLTAAAYSELAAEGVEIAVIEAGLGGRYDATNVISSEVQVLTSVGLDHTRWLGSTVAEIALEKLDVVQPGASLVLGPGMRPEAAAVAEQIAAQRGAALIRAGADPGVPVGALGAFQRRNFAVARAAAEALLGDLEPVAVAAAAADVRIPGRMQVTGEHPLTLFDGAHNPDGIAALVEALAEVVDGRRLVAVVSILEDKDAAAMLAKLIPVCDALVLTAGNNPRSLPPSRLLALVTELRGSGTTAVETVVEPHEALARGYDLARTDGVVIATGSLYLVADLVSPSNSAGRRRASML